MESLPLGANDPQTKSKRPAVKSIGFHKTPTINIMHSNGFRANPMDFNLKSKSKEMLVVVV